MTRYSWRQGGYCITGILGDTDVPHENFSTSCKKGVSPLWWRVPILLWALIIIFWSMAFFWGPTEKFFLYMTHWGLFFIVVETVFGIIVTVKTPRGRQPSDATFGLPWYVKTYWVLYNITIPVAFLITVFYWGILKTSTSRVVNYAPNPVLDVMVHAVNSVVMFIELACSAHPSRLLHVMQPLYFAGAYMLFTVTYYFAGGLDPWGNAFIYPVVDWSKPDQTMVVITLTALFLALMHLITVAVATARDAIARKRLNDNSGVYNDGFDATFGLPWYVKAYWICYNVTLPIAFFITVFYWIFLTGLDEDYGMNVTLDIFVHAINSVLMVILLATNRHPTRILHFYLAVLAGIVYLIFSVIFHFAGGIGPFGTSAIYPMLDWARPGLAAITAVGSAIGIIVMHLVVVGMSTARDALTKDCRKYSSSLSISNERYY